MRLSELQSECQSIDCLYFSPIDRLVGAVTVLCSPLENYVALVIYFLTLHHHV